MQGKVLHYDSNVHSGFISGFDGNRYSFAMTEWKKEKTVPQEGMTVDFEVEGKTATAIIPLSAPTESKSKTKTNYRFQNPDNHYIIDCKNAGLWSLFFGPFYLAYKGLWFHALISLILAIPTLGFSNIIYLVISSRLIHKHYMNKGWIPL